MITVGLKIRFMLAVVLALGALLRRAGYTEETMVGKEMMSLERTLRSHLRRAGD